MGTRRYQKLAPSPLAGHGDKDPICSRIPLRGSTQMRAALQRPAPTSYG